jgi:hypothetical protein
MSQERHEPELAAVEASLRALAPAAARIDRDRLMYAAGRRSAAHLWPWRGAAAALACTSAILGAMLFVRQPPTPIERIVVVHDNVPRPEPVPPDHRLPTERLASQAEDAVVEAPRAAGRGLTQTEQVLRWGPDVLPEPAGAAALPQPTIESLLGVPAKAPARTESRSMDDLLKPGDR